MRNRLFLLVLVAIILLIQAVLRTAAQATPFNLGNTLCGTPYWELRGALPLAVFGAGLLLVCTAAAAQCAQAAFLLADRRHNLTRNAGTYATAALWCGIPAMVASSGELPHIFPWLLSYDSAGWQTREHLEWALHGSLALLIICRLMHATEKQQVAYFTLPAALLCLLAPGQFGFEHAFILVPIGIMGAAGCLMLRSPRYRWAPVPLLSAVFMNGGLLWLTAGPVATIPAAIGIYFTTLLALAVPFFLKTTSKPFYSDRQ